MSKNITILNKKFPDFTQAYKDLLKFDPQEVWQLKTSGDNRIKTLPEVTLGTTAIGKSTFAKWSDTVIQEMYEPLGWGVLSTYTRDVKLLDFIKYSLKIAKDENYRKAFQLKDNTSVFILNFDDATGYEVKNHEIKEFFGIRHLVEDELSIREGIIYPRFVTHDWYGLSKIFRRYTESLVVLSVPPLDLYSRRHLISLFGEEAIRTLQAIYKKALKEDKYKGKGFVFLPYIPDNEESQVGAIQFKPVSTSKTILIKYGATSNIEADTEKRILYVPRDDSVSLVEDEETALAKLERKRKQDRERQAKKRLKDKESLEKILRKNLDVEKEFVTQVQETPVS